VLDLVRQPAEAYSSPQWLRLTVHYLRLHLWRLRESIRSVSPGLLARAKYRRAHFPGRLLPYTAKGNRHPRRGPEGVGPVSAPGAHPFSGEAGSAVPRRARRRRERPLFTADGLPTRSLRLVSWNLSGAGAHMHEAWDFATTARAHFLCLQELRTTRQRLQSQRGYSLDFCVPADQSEISPRGGVLVAFHQQTRGRRVVSREDLLVVQATVPQTGTTVFVASLYWRPQAASSEAMVETARELVEMARDHWPMVIAGDFNATGGPGICEPAAQGERVRARTNDPAFRVLLEDGRWSRAVSGVADWQPTYYHSRTSRDVLRAQSSDSLESCLDHVLVPAGWPCTLEVRHRGSDHCPLVCRIGVPVGPTRPVPQRLVRPGYPVPDEQQDEFAQALTAIVADLRDEGQPAERCLRGGTDGLEDRVAQVSGRVFGWRPAFSTKWHSLPFMSRGIRRVVHQRALVACRLRRHRRRLRRVGWNSAFASALSLGLWAQWRDSGRQLRKLVRRARRRIWRKLIRGLDHRSGDRMWPLYRALSRDQRASVRPKLPPDTRDVWQGVFSSQPIQDEAAIRASVDEWCACEEEPHGGGSVLAGEVSVEEVRDAARRLTSGTAPGLDGVLPEIWKLAAKTGDFASFLAEAFTGVVTSCEWPESWKAAELLLFPKDEGVPHDPRRFRPISLLSTLSKLLEKVIHARLLHWCDGPAQKLHTLQGGFRSGRGCLDQAFVLLHVMEKRRAARKPFFAALLDLEKAYDSTPHLGVLYSLGEKGLRGQSLRLLASWLHGRSAFIRDADGAALQLERGVPQGSVLSPLLFDCFIDPLASELQGAGIEDAIGTTTVGGLLFADDVSTLAPSKKNCQMQLNICVAFSDRWAMRWSYEKSVVLAFTATGKRSRAKVYLRPGQEPLRHVTSAEYLGVVIGSPARRDFASRLKKATTTADRESALMRGRQGTNPMMGWALARFVLVPQMIYGLELVYKFKSWEDEDRLIRRVLKQSLGTYTQTPTHEVRAALGMWRVGDEVLYRRVLLLLRLLLSPWAVLRAAALDAVGWLDLVPGYSQVPQPGDGELAVQPHAMGQAFLEAVNMLGGGVFDLLRGAQQCTFSTFEETYDEMKKAVRRAAVIASPAPRLFPAQYIEHGCELGRFGFISCSGVLNPPDVVRAKGVPDCYLCGLREGDTAGHLFLQCPGPDRADQSVPDWAALRTPYTEIQLRAQGVPPGGVSHRDWWRKLLLLLAKFYRERTRARRAALRLEDRGRGHARS
jgi:hypothetical protein